MEKKYQPIPKFNDHGSSCHGHANFMLDSTLEIESERSAVILAVDKRIQSNEADTQKVS